MKKNITEIKIGDVVLVNGQAETVSKSELLVGSTRLSFVPRNGDHVAAPLRLSIDDELEVVP